MHAALSSRERVRTAIARSVPDRAPVVDSPWSATVRRWEAEGLPVGKSPADHSIPKDVSFRKYSFVMDCVRRYGAY